MNYLCFLCDIPFCTSFPQCIFKKEFKIKTQILKFTLYSEIVFVWLVGLHDMLFLAQVTSESSSQTHSGYSWCRPQIGHTHWTKGPHYQGVSVALVSPEMYTTRGAFSYLGSPPGFLTERFRTFSGHFLK